MSVLKVILKTFLGLAVFLAGLYVAYYYICNIDTCSPLIIIVSLALITGGIMLLVKEGKSGETIMVDFGKKNLEKDQSKTESENFLEKNAKISAEWAESVDKKDKMESLKIAAAVEEEEGNNDSGI